MTEQRWIIWSEEHGAWWRPGEMGYTRSIREAGRYKRDHAERIVARANAYLDQRLGLKHFNEMAIPDPVDAERP